MKRKSVESTGLARAARRAAASMAVAVLALSAGTSMGMANDDPVQLRLWTVAPKLNRDGYQAVIDRYRAAHPEVEIALEYTESEAFLRTYKLVMSSDSAPDIIECPQGQSVMGPLVAAGLVIPLEPYAAQYGWTDRLSPSLVNQARMSDDGRSYGSGTLYGLPISGNVIGLYYNRAKAQALGIDPEAFATMADVDAALAAAKEAGEVPLMMGNVDGDPLAKLWEGVVSAYAGPEAKRAFVYGRAGARIDTPGVLAATQHVRDWVEETYIYRGAPGLGRDDGVARFARGEGVFMGQGTWYQGTLAEAMGDNVGFVLFPPAEAGAEPRASGSAEKPFCISSKSRHPEIAADLIDFFGRPENAQILYDASLLPIAPAEVDGDLPIAGQVLEAWTAVLGAGEGGGLTLHTDWATSSMGRTLNGGLQELYGGRIDSAALLARMQDDWAGAYAQ